MKVAVAGGGVSGLCAANALARAGHDVVCVEPSPRPGGLVRSERRDGYLCETGPQALLDGAPEVRRLLDELGLRARAIPAARLARRRFVYLGGRLREVPTGPLSLMTTDLLTLSGKLRLLREPLIPRRSRDDAEESVLDFARRRLGAEAAARLVAPAVIGVFAGDAARLSLPASFPRLAHFEDAHGGLLRGLVAARREGTAPGASISFPDGLEELPRALAARLGPRLLRGRVAAIERRDGAWRVAVETDTAASVPLPAQDAVVVATPPAVAAALLAPLVPTAAEMIATAPTVSVAVACLGFPRTAVVADLRAYGFLVARGEAPSILGAQYESSIFPDRAPAGRVLVRVMLGGAFVPAVIDLPDAALAQAAVADLRGAAGGFPDPAFTAIWRHRDALPQYEPGHLARAAAAEAALQRQPGLHVLGMALRGVGLADCIRNAEALAARIGPPR